MAGSDVRQHRLRKREQSLQALESGFQPVSNRLPHDVTVLEKGKSSSVTKTGSNTACLTTQWTLQKLTGIERQLRHRSELQCRQRLAMGAALEGRATCGSVSNSPVHSMKVAALLVTSCSRTAARKFRKAPGNGFVLSGWDMSLYFLPSQDARFGMLFP